jgi:K+-transporting ATPase ATPase C chain
VNLRRNLLASLITVVVFTAVFGLAYPLLMTGLSQVLFPGAADGSRIELDGRVVGSHLIGQSFTKQVPNTGEGARFREVPDRRYFQSRPSATGYSADVTYFNNLGPNNAELSKSMGKLADAYLKLERPYDPTLTRADVPVDAVSTSASGVDPHISQANALIQAHRVAAVRGLPLERVKQLIDENTAGRALGFLGEPGVNVLELNIALDREGQ